jgi:hypothetical protein
MIYLVNKQGNPVPQLTIMICKVVSFVNIGMIKISKYL